MPMKTVAKIDPEKEYQNARSIIDHAGKFLFDEQSLESLASSVDKLIVATRVLLEREDLRRGKKKVPKELKPKGRKNGEDRKKVSKLPSERYPHLEVKEDIIYPSKAPKCPCCSEVMKESGLFNVTEKLEVIPKRYYIQRNKRPKFNCGKCHSALVTTQALPSLIPSSNYGDSLIIDVTLSKFCDLIPIERYVQMAARNGIEDLPQQSLIGLTHQLADSLSEVYWAIKKEIQSEELILADETVHKMLEGDEKSQWYLWGFFTKRGSYFEARDTRSSEVAIDFIKDSKAKYLMTDGYAAYSKAVTHMQENEDQRIVEVYCNAHAVRYFKEASLTWTEECAPYLDDYEEVYKIERQIKSMEAKASLELKLSLRQKMWPYFERLKKRCDEDLIKSMPGSKFRKAINYFLNHYNGLTRCLEKVELPLDNNHSEREIRPSVVGRKTWYGTHSIQGAMTSAIHFSLVGSCKINGINPRNYYPWLVERLLSDKALLTPYEYSLLKEIQ